ncbi:MAG: hypothetical protein KAR47_06055, partial [Planctomycetes bacterium]|nr:hypothetical protein [Planctomycetota bacterium]
NLMKRTNKTAVCDGISRVLSCKQAGGKPVLANRTKVNGNKLLLSQCLTGHVHSGSDGMYSSERL